MKGWFRSRSTGVAGAVFLMLGGLFATVIPLWAQSSTEPTSEPLAVAHAALDDGRLEAAETLFRQVMAEQPDQVEGYLGLASALAAQGRTRPALELLRSTGEGLTGAGRYGEAARALRQAVELAPRSGAAQAELGRALSLDRQYLSAVDALEQAVALGRRDRRTRLYLAAALWESGRPEEAETAYRELVRTEPSLASVGGLGQLLVWRGHYAEAVELLRQVAQRQPASGAAQLELARALEGAERWPEAVAAYRRAVDLSPDLSQPRYGLARALRRAGELEAAAEELEVYRRLHLEEQESVQRQEVQEARLERGHQLLRLGQPAAAAEIFRQHAGTVPGLDGLATALLALGDAVGAAAALEQALAQEPSRNDLRLRLAELRQADPS